MIARKDFITQLTAAAATGKLLTPKHDPNNASTVYRSFRTILSHDLSSSLESFITGGMYSVTCYSDSKFPNGAGFFELIPHPDSGFSVVGSSIASGSIEPSGTLDRLVVVSGSLQGWHLMAESADGVASMVTNGRLRPSGSF